MTNVCRETWYLKRKEIEKKKFRVCYRLKNCFSIFGGTGSSSQMMVDGIILGQVSFRFSGSLFPKWEEPFGGKETIPERPRSLFSISLSS